MGIGPNHLRLYAEWRDQGWLKPSTRMLDIGAQELFCKYKPESLNRFIACFCGEPFSPADQARLADLGIAGELMSRAGFKYASIDYKPYPFGIQLDLNHDKLPSEHHGQYGLVTNHGTSEHILNQWNVFQTIHDAASVDALIYHAVPFSGEFEHGIINYNAKFWWALGEANGYQRLMFDVWSDADGKTLPESFFDTITGSPRAVRATSSWASVLFRKTSNKPFAGLIDPAFR